MDITKQSLEVKLPTIWTDEAAEVGRVREEKGTKKKNSEKRNSQRKNSKTREMVEKSRSTVFFQCGRKIRFAKAAGA